MPTPKTKMIKGVMCRRLTKFDVGDGAIYGDRFFNGELCSLRNNDIYSYNIDGSEHQLYRPIEPLPARAKRDKVKSFTAYISKRGLLLLERKEQSEEIRISPKGFYKHQVIPIKITPITLRKARK